MAVNNFIHKAKFWMAGRLANGGEEWGVRRTKAARGWRMGGHRNGCGGPSRGRATHEHGRTRLVMLAMLTMTPSCSSPRYPTALGVSRVSQFRGFVFCAGN